MFTQQHFLDIVFDIKKTLYNKVSICDDVYQRDKIIDELYHWDSLLKTVFNINEEYDIRMAIKCINEFKNEKIFGIMINLIDSIQNEEWKRHWLGSAIHDVADSKNLDVMIEFYKKYENLYPGDRYIESCLDHLMSRIVALKLLNNN